MCNSIKYLIFIFWLGGALICATLLFIRGFISIKRVLKFRSDCKSQNITELCNLAINDSSLNEITVEKVLICTDESVSSQEVDDKLNNSQYCMNIYKMKIIIILVDALRYDFVNFSPDETLPYRNKLTALHDLLNDNPERSKLFKFIADPPTSTFQRLNGLTTGSLPTFKDIDSNFYSYEVNEDNIIDQLVKAKKNITFMGDRTWTSLYPGRFNREFPFPSFNVWDLDSLDKKVKSKLAFEIQNKDWDLIIAHFLGVDHCGHYYGPNHSEMERKLLEMNEVIRDTVNKLDNNTMLFVIGDHGMTETGSHGGGSEKETSSALFVYSPWPLLNVAEPVEEVYQVDFVPTLASLMGVSIPFSNIGSVIVNLLPSIGSKADLESNWALVVAVLWTNIKQITLYIQEYAKTKTQFPPAKLVDINRNYQELKELVKSIRDDKGANQFLRESNYFMKKIRKMCEDVWVEFNVYAMFGGLVSYLVLLGLAFILICRMETQYLDKLIENANIHMAYGSLLLAALVLFLLKYFNILFDLEQSFYYCACIISVSLLIVIGIWLWKKVITICLDLIKIFLRSMNLWKVTSVNILKGIIMVLSVMFVFSNSYINEEAFTSSFLVISLVFISVLDVPGKVPEQNTETFGLISFLKLIIHSTKGRTLILSLVLFGLVRFSIVYVVCRPEQNCPEQVAILSDLTRCVLSIVCILLFVACVHLYLRSNGNLVGYSATVLVTRFVPVLVVVVTGTYWVLQILPSNTQHNLFQPWQLSMMPRTIMCVLLFSLALVLLRPLSVYNLPNNTTPQSADSSVTSPSNQATVNTNDNDGKQCCMVIGLATVYSASFINIATLFTLIVVLLLGREQGLAAVLLSLSLWLLAAISSIIRHTKGTADVTEVPWWSVVSWGLSSQHFFYATGHQATFSSMNWNSAFLLSDNSTLTSLVVPATLVLGNVFSSYVLHAVLLPLLIVVPHSLTTFSTQFIPATDAIKAELTLFDSQPNQALFKLCFQYMIFFGQKVFGCLLSVSHHARHFKVWHVFAPKLIFDVVAFIITLPSLIIGFFLFQQISRRLHCLFRNLRR